MKFLDEYRDADAVRRCADVIAALISKPWSIMEVCGGQTHAIVRFGLDELMPPELTLIHGPGCPVCVTPVETIDRALAIAAQPGVVFCSFGDMLRVPGSEGDLFSVKARGADVRVVYSPLDALALAETLPSREVVFFAVGFETTAPANAMAVFEARRKGIRNFSLLVAHVLVPPAIEAILSAPRCAVNGVLAAGHVCTIMGLDEYRPLVTKYRVPIVATGFEPLDILQGIAMCVQQLESGRAEVENQYERSIRSTGNEVAQAMLNEIFELAPRAWRGLGVIPGSGMRLRRELVDYDAECKFEVSIAPARENSECRMGLVLQGLLKPPSCPAFGTRCTPDTPLGATMVSSEGACAAYFRHRRRAS